VSGKSRRVSFIYSLAIGALLGLVMIFFVYFNLFANLERNAFDLLFSIRGSEEPAPEVMVVGITEGCLEELGRWPWERDIHARLLDILKEGEAAAVGMDIIIAEPSADPSADAALIEATARGGPSVYPAEASPETSTVPGFLRPQNLVLPLPGLLEHAGAGFINVTPDGDGILRNSILWMEHQGEPLASFDLALWAAARGMKEAELYEKLDSQFTPAPEGLTLENTSFPLDRGGRTLINYSGGPGSFPVLPYHLVVDGAYPPSTFIDKVILVGYYAPGLGDYYFTPHSKDTPMYGVEVHANVLHTLLQAGPIHQAPLSTVMALVFFLGAGTMPLFRALKPLWSFLCFLLIAAGFFALAVYLFDSRSFYLESTYPLITLGLGYVVALGYNFILEQRDKQRVTRLFGRYVAPQVVEEILEVGEENLKLGGTRREVTLLFVDIRGFTPLSERLSPEEVVEVLNQFFDLVTASIFENRGTLDKFMGDAAMAIFNAPLHEKDHAYWAVKAARDIVQKGKLLQEKVQEISGVTLNFGIGINTGYAVVGNIGSENRMEYTAIGDAVNLAARLESNAEPGQVLISESTYQAVAGQLPLDYAGKISVKGKAEPVQIYQLSSENNESSEKAAAATEKSQG